MDELQEALKDLRDIHQPESVPFWPPAPGWWILLILSFLLVYFFMRWLKKEKTPKYKKMAIEELKNITTNYEVQRNEHKTVNECALLIRKILLVTDKDQNIAGMIDDEWLAYLDKRSDSNLFSQGAGQALTSAIYQKDATVDAEGLLEATRVLLKNV